MQTRQQNDTPLLLPYKNKFFLLSASNASTTRHSSPQIFTPSVRNPTPQILLVHLHPRLRQQQQVERQAPQQEAYSRIGTLQLTRRRVLVAARTCRHAIIQTMGL